MSLYPQTVCALRRLEIILRSIKGEEIKAIAIDTGYAQESVRRIIWAAGFRTMQVSAQERALLMKHRATEISAFTKQLREGMEKGTTSTRHAA